MSRWSAVTVGVLCALAVAVGPLTSYALPAMAVGSALLPAVASVAALRSSRRPGAPRALLRLTALSAGFNALAYAGFHVQWIVQGHPAALTLAEPLYLAGYLSLLVGWVVHLHRNGGRSRPAALDAALVVAGPAAVVVALVVEPLLGGRPPLQLVLIALYPLVDLLLLVTLLRAVFTRVLRGLRAVLWVGAACFLLVGDAVFFVLLQQAAGHISDWYQTPYAVAFGCLAFAVTGSQHQPGRASAAPVHTSSGRAALLWASTCVPSAVLVAQGLLGYTVDWLVLGTGALLTAALAGLRLQAALQTSRAQAAVLTQLARYDDLTGLPNRRELSLALQAAVEDPQARVVAAVLDLDHFKRVNDDGGHAAGDLLLQDATRRWHAHLPPGAHLYRWGGEEFVLLLRDTAPDDAVALLERVRTATPHPHTVSIGMAVRRPGEPGAALLVRADEQLYRAKSTGRDRLCGDGVPATLPAGSSAGLPATPPEGPPATPPEGPPADAVERQRFADALPSRATSAG